MSGQKNKTAGSPVLQKVVAFIPPAAEDLQSLGAYLEIMECGGLLGVPWTYQSEPITMELLGSPTNQFDGQIRAHPDRWTVELWKAMYDFREGEVKMVERIDEYLKGKFLRTADPKDGYVIDSLKDPDARLVMAFLNPIFHPQKPKRVVAKMASLFLGAMRGKIKVDWASLMEEQVDRMVRNLAKGLKMTIPVSTYMGHLYVKTAMLGPEEQDEYDKLLNIQQYGGQETDTSDLDDKSAPNSPAVT
jgi:hypothetical protein